MQKKKEGRLQRVANGSYKTLPNGGYYNLERNWSEYILLDRIFFSHRRNECAKLSDRLHVHRYYELYISGMDEQLEYISDEGAILLRHGMAVLTKPNQFHAYRLLSPGVYDRYIIYFTDPADLFSDINIMNFTKEGNAKYAVFDQSEETVRCLRQAEATLSSPEESAYVITDAYLRICDLFLSLSRRQALVNPENSSSLPVFIREVKEYVDANFASIRSVEALAQQFFYSREYLSRSFKRYYNTPLYEYILERKVLYSAAFLEKGERVSDAAEKAGFANPSAYIQHFRRYFGCSPTEYRARKRL